MICSLRRFKYDSIFFKPEQILSFLDVVIGNTARIAKSLRTSGKYPSPVDKIIRFRVDKISDRFISMKYEYKVIIEYVSKERAYDLKL